MPTARVTKKAYLEDRQGVKFADVVNDPEQPFDCVLAFFNDADRQRRMEESELHHDRAPLAGVVRELESQPEIDQFLSGVHSKRSTRLTSARYSAPSRKATPFGMFNLCHRVITSSAR